MRPSDRHLVFDVGGTLLRAAVYDGSHAALVDLAKAPAPSYLRHPADSWPDLRARLLDEMSGLRRRLDPAGELASAALAFPGPVDRERRVLAAPTLWGPAGRYPHRLEEDVGVAWPGVDVRVVNDVTAAGFRYLRAEDDDFCVVTVSTGIGNKVFVGGRPLLGRSGRGGEIGHVQVDASSLAPTCDCGGVGHLGAIASGRATLARARARALSGDGFAGSALSRGMGLAPETLTAEALAAAYRDGDPWAGGVVRPAADALASALATIHLGVGVDRFVLIGGFALGLGEGFAREVESALHARCWRGDDRSASVRLGAGDGHCALLGAGRAKHLGILQ